MNGDKVLAYQIRTLAMVEDSINRMLAKVECEICHAKVDEEQTRIIGVRACTGCQERE